MLLRLTRLLTGLVLCGAGISTTIRAGLGLAPWDVFHQGVSLHTPLSIGQATVAASFVVLAGWIPLRQRPGIGTILNALVVGASVDLLLPHIPSAAGMAGRMTLLALGPSLMGLGTAIYIGAGMGTGPRDGLMTGIAARGLSVRLTRTAIEGAVLVIGWLLGGRVGIGTVVFTLAVGPMVQFSMEKIPGRYLQSSLRPAVA